MLLDRLTKKQGLLEKKQKEPPLGPRESREQKNDKGLGKLMLTRER